MAADGGQGVSQTHFNWGCAAAASLQGEVNFPPLLPLGLWVPGGRGQRKARVVHQTRLSGNIYGHEPPARTPLEAADPVERCKP